MWREFKTKQKTRPRIHKTELNCNHLDLYYFSEILQVQHQQIKQSEIDYYLLASEGDYLSAKTIRYCLSCLSKGYHSPIHQLLFIKYCPYHHRILQEGCPVCKQPISIQIENNNIKKPFQCTSCNKRILNPRILAKETDQTERSKSFSRVSDWLLARKACTEDSERFDVWLNTKFSEALRRKRINSLPVIWTELTGMKPPFQIDTGVGGQLMKILIKGKL